MNSLSATISPESRITSRDAAKSARVLFFPFDNASTRTLAEAEKALSTPADVARLPFDLTIIVPIFNTRHYALDTLRSVLVAANQLRVQIICVNDGSTDNSLQLVIDFLLQRDFRASLIVDQPNRGLGPARNVALPLVRGEYLASLDSDDIVDASGYSDLLAFAREYDCDVVWGRTTYFSDNLQDREAFADSWIWNWMLNCRKSVVLYPEFDHRVFMAESNTNPRVVRTAFFKQHKFLYPEGFVEDLPVQIALLTRAGRVGFFDTPIYLYRLGRTGKLTQQRSQRCFDVISMLRKALDEMLNCQYSPDHGASFLYLVSRLVMWCAKGLPLNLRKRYFELACKEFKRVPEPWVESFFRRFPGFTLQIFPEIPRFHAFNLAFVVWCFVKGEVDELWRQSANTRSRWIAAKFAYQVGGLPKLICSAVAAIRRLVVRSAQ